MVIHPAPFSANNVQLPLFLCDNSWPGHQGEGEECRYIDALDNPTATKYGGGANVAASQYVTLKTPLKNIKNSVPRLWK